MKPRWIFPSAHDPRNVVLAEWAYTLATIQWLLMIGYAIAMPTCSYPPPSLIAIAIIASPVLMLVGWRGLASGHACRIGSIVLFSTNLFYISYFLLLIFWS
jgi:hypothetical protein